MGIILIFLVAVAAIGCAVSTAAAAILVLTALYLTHHHHPAWCWPGALLLTAYAGVLLRWYWKSSWSSDGVPEGLHELWSQVGRVVVLWPLPAAVVALLGAVVVLCFRWLAGG
jgi:hypothetical protein